MARRIVVGRKLRSEQAGTALLPKRVALPVFASDALSSVSYAPDEIFIMLSVAGVSAYAFSWKVGIAVAVVLLVVVASYRQNVHAYPSGGGDYEVATVNLGRSAGVTVASALLVDYVLTVAVSVSAAVQNVGAAAPVVGRHETLWACVAVGGLALVNFRGVRESSVWFVVPAYGFMIAVGGMALYAVFRSLRDDLPQVESASFEVAPVPAFEGGIGTLAMVVLLARAFSYGSVALTGVQTVANSVPAFQRPKSRNAATTLLLMGGIGVTMFLSIIGLAHRMGMQFVDPQRLDRVRYADGSPLPADYDQHTVIAQIARAVFSDLPPGFYFVITMTGIVLLVAANTAFNGFPVLGSILARDGFAPRQFGAQGDRLAYTNGIIFLSVLAMLLILVFRAEPTRLIQLYIVGVFVAFTLSQLGMVRHWTRRLSETGAASDRGKMHRSRVISGFGLLMTGLVLVIVVVTKFLAGAWITLLAMAVLIVFMTRIRRHYDRVAAELVIGEEDPVLPTRVHAVVLVSQLHKPTMRALAYAKATRPNLLEAIYVGTDPAMTDRLLAEWDERHIDVPLKVLYSPYREVVRPVVEYAAEIRRNGPRGVVAVYIPEYVVGHWWERLLHNRASIRLKARLMFSPNVMVISVPYQLRGSEIGKQREDRELSRLRPGDVRRGAVRRERPRR